MSRYSMPGSWTSSTYVPRPRMKRGSSFRLIECPIPPTSGVVLSAITSLPLRARLGRRGSPDVLRLALPANLGRRVLDGLDDVDVPGAPAEVAGDGPADVVLTGR